MSEYPHEQTLAAPSGGLAGEPSSTRKFATGAIRDQDTTKLDYEGFLCPLVLARFAEHMHKNRIVADGTMRASDSWQKGVPPSVYMKSLWRHLMTAWGHHRNVPKDEAGWESLEDALCGVIFNAQGYLHEILKAKHLPDLPDLPGQLSLPLD